MGITGRGEVMRKLSTAAIFATSMLAATFASAQNVVLKANDGSVDVSGELVSFEDGFYTIRTQLGQMRMSAARVSCQGDACPQLESAQTDFVITGSDTVGDELMPLMLEGFAASLDAEANIITSSNASVKTANLVGDQGFGEQLASILIESTGSSSAFTALLERAAEIGMSSRRIRPDEARALRADDAGNMVSVDQEHVIGVDSLLVLVNPNNPVDTLSLDQISEIYAGLITNWSEVGGPDLAIQVFTREEGSGTLTTFTERTVEPRDLSVTSSATIVLDNIEMARAVVDTPGAIGYAGVAFQRGAKSLNIITECEIRTRPDAFSAKTEEYPFQRRLYVYNRADTLSETGQALVDFMTSSAADGVIEKSGFINLGVVRQSQDNVGGRMRGLIRSTSDGYEVSLMRQLLVELLDWDRLSTTFRFSSGSTKLSNKALADLERLLNYLDTEDAGVEIALVAFTDNVGPFESNQTLSEQRAEEVADALVAAAGGRLDNIDITTLGFGPLSPAACNDSDEGRAINRRVEVWIRNR